MIKQLIEQLRMERHSQRLSLEELSIKSGVSVKHICNTENFKTNPSMVTLQKLANALGVKIKVQIINQAKASGE